VLSSECKLTASLAIADEYDTGGECTTNGACRSMCSAVAAQKSALSI
jgi:hypothetical protein